MKKKNIMLLHEVINQIETDLYDKYFESLSGLLTTLIKNKETKKLLIEYLSDSAKKNLIEGRTIMRF